MQKSIIHPKRNSIMLCINCDYCYKNKDDTLSCENDYFDSLEYKKVFFLTPFDFDCIEYGENSE